MADRKQRLIRAVVTRSPAKIFQAEEACLVVCWLPARKLDGEMNYSVALNDNWDPTSRWAGVELDSDKTLTVFLDVGESLYSVSKDESHLSMSVIPAKYAGVFGGGM